jgi:hypothetical protein
MIITIIINNIIIICVLPYTLYIYNCSTLYVFICIRKSGNSFMTVPCIMEHTRNDQRYALICTTPLFHILAPTCFDSSLPSSRSFLDPSELLEIQIEWVVYHIMCGYVACGHVTTRVTDPSQKPLPDNTQHSKQTDIHDPGEIRTHNLSKRAAANLPIRPRGQGTATICLR